MNVFFYMYLPSCIYIFVLCPYHPKFSHLHLDPHLQHVQGITVVNVEEYFVMLVAAASSLLMVNSNE